MMPLQFATTMVPPIKLFHFRNIVFKLKTSIKYVKRFQVYHDKQYPISNVIYKLHYGQLLPVTTNSCTKFQQKLYYQHQTILKLTSVGRETGILSEALDQAPAFRILMLTESER